MLKKALICIVSVVIFCIGVLFYIALPYMADPLFTVMNTTNEPVRVITYWREQVKDLGQILANDEIQFEINGEATISFTVTFLNGSEISSTPIYFTSTTEIVATINESSIKVIYVPGT